jgi:hypothetical protein
MTRRKKHRETHSAFVANNFDNNVVIRKKPLTTASGFHIFKLNEFYKCITSS